MARVYSESLIQFTVSPEEAYVFDITDAYVCVVRDISGFVFADYASGGQLLIAGNSLTIATWFWPTNFSDSIHWEGRGVLPGPSTLEASVQGTDAYAEVLISGYLLSLP